MKNNKDNLITNNEINNIKREDEKKILNNNNIKVNNKPNIKPEIFSQVTQRDLRLFKEDFLQTIKEIKNEINMNISDKYEAFNKLIEESNQKLYNFESDKNRFIQKLNFLEEKNEILSKISQTTNDLKNELNVHLLHIQNCQKDLSNMGFKYDKIITSNLMIPGLIGPMCTFNNLSEYILKNRDVITDVKNDIQSSGNEINLTKKKLDELNNNYQNFKKSIDPAYQAYIDLKMEEIKKIMEQKFESYSEKISSVRIENLVFAKNFLEKERNLDEYLIKMDGIKKSIMENNTKSIEKTKKLNNYTLSQLEKNINESINLKKSVLELANIFSKQKRAYGDENLNENKREIIMNFGNMISNLMKDLINQKNLIINNNTTLKKNNEYEDNLMIRNKNIKDFIDANPKRQDKRKLTQKEKNLYSNNKFFKSLNDYHKQIKENKETKRSSKNNIFNNLININNKNNISTSSQRKMNNHSNKSNKSCKSNKSSKSKKSNKSNKINLNDENNNKVNTNILKDNYKLKKENSININTNYINNQILGKGNFNSTEIKKYNKKIMIYINL